MRKILATILFLYLTFTSIFAQAITDFADDDSCIPDVTLVQRIVNNISTLGMYSLYSYLFHMKGATATGNSDINSSETEASCKVPSTTVRYCYQYVTLAAPPNQTACMNGKDGDFKFFLIPPTLFRVKNVADKVCVQVFAGFAGFQDLGCRYRPDPVTLGATSPNCFVASSCQGRTTTGPTGENAVYSKSLIPVTAIVVQCVRDSLNTLFNSTQCSNYSSSNQNLFASFQAGMRNLIRILLLLYVIFFGMKITLSNDLPNKGEVFLFIMKFILVLYFSVGISQSRDSYGAMQYNDGITTIIRPIAENAGSMLSNIIYKAAGSQNFCQYSDLIPPYPVQTNAETGGITDYNYLALWDSLDCRIFFYLGMQVDGITSSIMTIMIMQLIGPAFFGMQILILLFTILFTLFFISIVVFFVHFTVVSLIALNFLIYLAPLFVPFALFKYTKGYFDSWLKMIISYSLQPIIITAFIALMLTIFDQIMYGTCVFKQGYQTIKGISYPAFELTIPTTSPDECTSTLGYMMKSLLDNQNDIFQTIYGLFFTYTAFAPGVIGNLLTSLIRVALFGYLFYEFSKMLTQFAGDITGGYDLGGLTIKPTQVMDTAIHAAKAAVKAKMGDKKGAAEEAKKATGNDSGAQASGSRGTPGSGSGASASGSIGGGGGSTGSIGGGGGIPGK